MPVDKTPDGKIVEEKTSAVEIGKGRGKKTVDNNRTLLSSDNTGAADDHADTQDSLDEKTRLAGAPTAGRTDVAGAGAGSVNRPNRKGSGSPSTQLYRGKPTEDAENAKVCDDPVVGWLVVEKGPGAGFCVNIGIGMNAVGRGRDQRVSIDYSDLSISSTKHFFISFDPRSGGFAIHRGEGSNLTYLNGDPVYQSESLTSFDIIEIGSTQLRFVALCGDRFTWDDE